MYFPAIQIDTKKLFFFKAKPFVIKLHIYLKRRENIADYMQIRVRT